MAKDRYEGWNHKYDVYASGPNGRRFHLGEVISADRDSLTYIVNKANLALVKAIDKGRTRKSGTPSSAL